MQFREGCACWPTGSAGGRFPLQATLRPGFGHLAFLGLSFLRSGWGGGAQGPLWGAAGRSWCPHKPQTLKCLRPGLYLWTLWGLNRVIDVDLADVVFVLCPLGPRRLGTGSGGPGV